MGTTPRRALIVGGVAFAALAFAPRIALAAPPPPELMARLAATAESMHAMRDHASYVLDGHMDRLDGDGKVDEVRELKMRIEADGKKTRTIVIRYTEGGEDKTDDARKKAHDGDEDRDKGKDKPLSMPFRASQQPRYTFDLVERDARDPSRVRIAFVPKEPDEDTIEGSAWFDERTARPLSAGFKLSKPGMFVDYVHVTVRFDAETPMGPAVSELSFEGKGGVLFLRKKFRGWAKLGEYRIVP